MSTRPSAGPAIVAFVARCALAFRRCGRPELHAGATIHRAARVARQRRLMLFLTLPPLLRVLSLSLQPVRSLALRFFFVRDFMIERKAHPLFFDIACGGSGPVDNSDGSDRNARKHFQTFLCIHVNLFESEHLSVFFWQLLHPFRFS